MDCSCSLRRGAAAVGLPRPEAALMYGSLRPVTDVGLHRFRAQTGHQQNTDGPQAGAGSALGESASKSIRYED